MAMNRKWYWILGTAALIIAGFLLRKKGIDLWHRVLDRMEA